MTTTKGRPPQRILAVHPSPDGYGADRMFLEALRGMRQRGLEVTVTIPEDGPLVGRLRDEGFPVVIVDAPVLRKALLTPRGLVGLAVRTPLALVRLARLVRTSRADAVYVNTVTIPHWLAAGRLARRPTVCHVREAEEGRRLLLRLLAAPLLLADRIITNSRHTSQELAALWPRLDRRATTVHNGFAVPTDAAEAGPLHRPARLLLVGRLSARKGQHVAVAALADLARRGHDAELHLVGSAYPGYEWYVEQLQAQAAALGVTERLHLHGYHDDPSALLGDADVVLVPSLVEPFGNVAVEGQLAARPVVASATGGLVEIVDDGATGLLVPPGDRAALAAAVARLLEDDVLREELARRGRKEALERFDPDRYREGVARVLEQACT